MKKKVKPIDILQTKKMTKNVYNPDILCTSTHLSCSFARKMLCEEKMKNHQNKLETLG